MAFDRAAFFAAVRTKFGPLNQRQVDGFGTLLNVWTARYSMRTPIGQLAYVLATAWHETARTMQPIAEIGSTAYFVKLYDVQGARASLARSMGNTSPGDGPRYRGRGYVQLTWKSNYAKATDKLRALGVLTASESLVTSPELAMMPTVAAAILFEGMEGGWFTGRDLDETIIGEPEYAEFVAARRIINGTDRADLIAGYAKTFLAALNAGARAADAPAVAVAKPAPAPLPRPDTTPVAPPPVAPAPKPAAQPAPAPADTRGFWRRLLDSIFR